MLKSTHEIEFLLDMLEEVANLALKASQKFQRCPL